jgi:hypothetical protein
MRSGACFARFLQKRVSSDLVSLSRVVSVASFQHGALESRLTWMFPEASVRAWMPAIRAGMTTSDFSLSGGQRKLMNRFVVS